MPPSASDYKMEPVRRTKRKISDLEEEDKDKMEQQLVSNPFYVFPEELWLMMVERLTNSLDVHNVFRAFPVFHNSFTAKFETLQFNQVSPMLFEYESSSEVVPLRSELVSRNWCLAVADFLEKGLPVLPTKRHKSRSQFQMEVPSPNFSFTDQRQNIYMSRLFPIEFTSAEEIQTFRESLTVDNQQAVTGRLVKLCNQISLGRSDCWAAPEFLEECMKLLAVLGQDIRYIELEFGTFSPATDQDAHAIMENIVTCLENLPNVRELSINFDSKDKKKLLLNAINSCVNYPEMPFLDSLKFSKSTRLAPQIFGYFYKGYCSSGRITKLSLPLKVWKPSYRWQFQNITELEFDVNSGEVNVAKMIKNLGYSSLKKVSFVPNHRYKLLTLPDVFKSLQRLDVEEFVIENADPACMILCPNVELPTVPSIKYLSLVDASELGFQFLLGLPSLEYLHVRCRDELKERFLSGRSVVNEQLTTLVRNYLYNPQVPKSLSLWQEFPRLKALIVEDKYEIKHFVPAYGNHPVTFRINK